MKIIERLGLLIGLIAVMAMALTDASSAVAEPTALCTEDAVELENEECPEAKRIAHVHETTQEGNKALLLGTVKIECDVLFLGDVQNANNLGDPLEISGHLTYTNCKTSEGTNCTVAEVAGTETKIKVSRSGHESGAVTSAFEVNFKCGFLMNCTYNGTGLEAHALGPLLSEAKNGEARLEEQTTNHIKGFCPETAKLDLLTTPLEATYISR